MSWRHSNRSSMIPRYCPPNSITKPISSGAFYAVPYKSASAPFHVWRSMVERAGYKMSDIPDKWDARWSWFQPMQAKLRDSGMREAFALGVQMTTNGPSDGNAVFHGFLIANGGKDIVTPDGKEHTADPRLREAVVKTITFITNAYKQGDIPPGAISWNVPTTTTRSTRK